MGFLRNIAFKTAIKQSLLDVTKSIETLQNQQGLSFEQAVIMMSNTDICKSFIDGGDIKFISWEQRFFALIIIGVRNQMPNDPYFGHSGKDNESLYMLVSKWLVPYGGRPNEILALYSEKTKKKITPNEAAEILFYGTNQIIESNSVQLGELVDAFSISEDRMTYANFEIIFVVNSLVRIVAMNSIKPPIIDQIDINYVDRLVNFICSSYKVNGLRSNYFLRAEAYRICCIVSNNSNIGQSIKNMFVMILHQYKNNKENEFLNNYLKCYENDQNSDYLKIQDFMPEISSTILFSNMLKSAHEFMKQFENKFSVQ